MNILKVERKQKLYWMSKVHREYYLNDPNTWNVGTWYYCHKDTGGKCDGKYCKNKPSECQGTMKMKLIHPKKVRAKVNIKRNPRPRRLQVHSVQ